MFDNYLVRENSLFNIRSGTEIVGFCISVRHANYRGIYLSLHNGYYLRVDGETYPVTSQRFEINEKPPRKFSETMKECWEHWDYDDEAFLHVALPNGLAPGKHTVDFQQCVVAGYGYLPTDEEWVKNPPIPGNGSGSDKTPQIITYELELQGERSMA
jgi:hypothetical protein